MSPLCRGMAVDFEVAGNLVPYGLLPLDVTRYIARYDLVVAQCHGLKSAG